jgi:hypothetical protein
MGDENKKDKINSNDERREEKIYYKKSKQIKYFNFLCIIKN